MESMNMTTVPKLAAGLLASGLFLLASCNVPASDDTKILGGQTPQQMYSDQRVAELVEAVLEDDGARIRSLAQAGADVNALPAKGAPPLLWAMHFDRPVAMITLLELGADACKHIPALYGDSVIMAVIRTERIEQLRLLLSANVDPNCKVSEPGDLSLLAIAARSGPLEQVKLLVEAGADIDFRNEFRSTPVSKAIAGGNFDIVLYLLQSGYRHQLDEVAGLVQLNRASSEREPDRQAVIAWLKANGISYPQFPEKDP
jgi:ankyrin repeat protein